MRSARAGGASASRHNTIAPGARRNAGIRISPKEGSTTRPRSPSVAAPRAAGAAGVIAGRRISRHPSRVTLPYEFGTRQFDGHWESAHGASLLQMRHEESGRPFATLAGKTATPSHAHVALPQHDRQERGAR